MDPFVQSALTLVIGLAFLAFGVIFIVPLADRIADHFERKGRRPLPPAE